MVRNSTIIAAALGASLLAPGVAGATTYDVDQAHTQVLFKVKHLGISTVTGRFTDFVGEFSFDPANVETSTLDASVQVSSVNTGVERRDNHLRSADFFDAANNPEMTFVSTGVSDVEGNAFKLHGDLTVRGTTRPVVFDVEFGGLVTDPWGNRRSAFTATAGINRQEFGLLWNEVIETGGLVVSDDVKIVLEVEGIARGDEESDSSS